MTDRTLTQTITLDLSRLERLDRIRPDDGHTRLMWCLAPSLPDCTFLGREQRYRAPWRLAAQSPPAWLGDAIRSTRPHPAALALGLHSIDRDGAGLIYLSAHDAVIGDTTPVLIVEAHTTQAQRVALAVDRLRQADLPAEAEHLQRALDAAQRDLPEQLASHTLRLSADRVAATVAAHAKIHPKPTNAPGLWSWVEMVDLLRLI